MNKNEENILLLTRVYGPASLESLTKLSRLRKKAVSVILATLYESEIVRRISDKDGVLVYDCTKLGKEMFKHIAKARAEAKAAKPRRASWRQHKVPNQN